MGVITDYGECHWPCCCQQSGCDFCEVPLAMLLCQSGCARPCFMGNGFACCDNVWLPGFNIPNILFLDQNRVKQGRRGSWILAPPFNIVQA